MRRGGQREGQREGGRVAAGLSCNEFAVAQLLVHLPAEFRHVLLREGEGQAQGQAFGILEKEKEAKRDTKNK